MSKYNNNMIVSHCIRLNATELKKSIEENIILIQTVLSGDDTLVIRRFSNKRIPEAQCCIIYLDGMTDPKTIDRTILSPIMLYDPQHSLDQNALLDELQFNVVSSADVDRSTDVPKLLEAILHGDTVLLLEGYDTGMIISTKGWPSRAISEPDSAKSVRGPREGFSESVLTNLSLLRKIISNPGLQAKFMTLGTQTSTQVCICYLDGLVHKEILDELTKRLEAIEIDAVLDSGYVQELIRDEPFSPFLLVGHSEKPDVVSSKILEGRIAILVDGSPFVLTVPYVLAETFQVGEDYYNNYMYASFNRILRILAAFFSTSIPSLYIALVTFHQEALPTPLLISISSSLKGVPFPTSLSMFIMLILFDFLREAGSRIPSSIGQTVNIVGTLVLGQAAIEAKLVSAPVVIITALSGILTLMNMSLVGPVIIVRFLFLFMSSLFGIYGLIFGIILVLLHLISLRSFGIPYLLGMTSLKKQSSQDIWIRAPWWTITLRSKIISARNTVRQSKRPARKK